ncbi:FAD-dependent oxidoreductase [Herbiconiux ginsengi]|uniref:Assimilatory nitrate reductase (NADH) beta subunit n=1 Tax=Herbiconiux ginsengi TaxID=381665 RepID=A0A1H3JFW0_9MICO|nr:FAD-dependent oxidoreductase [Herbiconiux ginsengi]SDY38792.1 assimilatory nitrate reductase (NADH) beta subunit [Herbiconiux ginsengi]
MREHEGAGAPPMHVVLVGFGPVGARFVEELLDAVRSGVVRLTVLGAEAHDPYNRVLLAEYAVGRAERERLDLLDTAAAVRAGVDVRLGEIAAAIDRERQEVRLASGGSVRYDRLVLATGARANVPTLVGLEGARRERGAAPDRGRVTGAGSADTGGGPDISRGAAAAAVLDSGRSPLPPGVVVLRDLADAEVVRSAIHDSRRVVVLGAGVLGMELALAVAEQGAEVVVVHHGDIPMARNLDRGGGRLLSRAARSAGVAVVAHARAETLLLRDGRKGERRFDALGCADGKVIPGDLLVLSCGVGARTELAEGAGLAVAAGILVDEELRSWTDPDVFAIGDCAQVADPAAGADGVRSGVIRMPGAPSGLIGPGWRQADWLARTFASEATALERPPLLPPERPAVVMLKAEGVDVVSGGDISAELWDEEPAGHADSCRREITQWADPARGSYLKLITRGGVVEGFVSVGLARAGAELTLLFERGSEVPSDRSVLLRLDAAGEPVTASDPLAPDATVCWCNGVSVQSVVDAGAAGDGSVACVSAATRAGTGCGGCKGRIAEILASAALVAARPLAAPFAG